jgi:hypothetical protein
MDSYWARHRPAYRCRHGHSSARPRSLGHPKILYVREDQLLACLRHHREHPALRNGDPHAVADYLATHSVILVGDHAGWMIETNTTTIQLEILPAATTRISVQRTEGEGHSRSVWE